MKPSWHDSTKCLYRKWNAFEEVLECEAKRRYVSPPQEVSSILTFSKSLKERICGYFDTEKMIIAADRVREAFEVLATRADNFKFYGKARDNEFVEFLSEIQSFLHHISTYLGDIAK